MPAYFDRVPGSSLGARDGESTTKTGFRFRSVVRIMDGRLFFLCSSDFSTFVKPSGLTPVVWHHRLHLTFSRYGKWGRP